MADALGWPYEVRQVFPKAEWVLGKPRFAPGLDHLDLGPLGTARAALARPDRHHRAAAVDGRLWVQDQSGGRSRIVLLGRPKRWAERFALIVAPRQFKIPPRDNLVQLDLPLLRADPAAVAAAGEAWRERLAGLARPLTAVLIGGETKPFRFDAAVARELLAELAPHRRRATAARSISPPAGARGPMWWRRWSAACRQARCSPLVGRDRGATIPIWRCWRYADRFVVTGDSISMMVEVASLGRPLAIFAAAASARSLLDRARAALATPAACRPASAHRLHRLGIAGYGRDLGEIRRVLIERGLAVPLGEPFRSTGAPLAGRAGADGRAGSARPGGAPAGAGLTAAAGRVAHVARQSTGARLRHVGCQRAESRIGDAPTTSGSGSAAR